jgi:hypothetical protein
MLQVPFRTIMEVKPDLISHVVYSTGTEEDVESESASVVVKLEMPNDSEISTANNQHSAIHMQDSAIKTEPFNHRHVAHDDDTTRDDDKHIMEYKRICVKHEYKYEEDSTHVMSHTEEPIHSGFVKSKTPFDSGMSTTQCPHNVPDGHDSKVKIEVIVHRNLDSGDAITHIDVQHSVEYICPKHEYKDEEDSTPGMAPTVDAKTVCATTIEKQYTCDTCTKSFQY